MTSSIAITPALANTLRSSDQYYVEVVMTPPTNVSLPMVETVDISGILRETHQQKGGSKIYTFSVSDYFIKHGATFTEVERLPVFLQCDELTKGRYLTVLVSDQGVALSGSNSAVVKTLPTRLNFRFGKLNLEDLSDFTIYHPNSVDPIPGQTNSPSQDITKILIRFALNINYLTESI